MKTTLVLCICGVMGMGPVNGQDARCPGGEGKIAAPYTLTLARYAAGTGEFKMNVGSRIYTRPDAVFAILSA